MAPEHPNAQHVRNLFAAFRAGDVDTIRATIPEDAVWHFPGRGGKLAGTHRGRQGILEFLAAVVHLSGGSFHLELMDVLANDRWAVAMFTGRGERDGKRLENPTLLRMRLDAGRIVEVWEFVWDLYAVDDFWA